MCSAWQQYYKLLHRLGLVSLGDCLLTASPTTVNLASAAGTRHPRQLLALKEASFTESYEWPAGSTVLLSPLCLICAWLQEYSIAHQLLEAVQGLYDLAVELDIIMPSDRQLPIINSFFQRHITQSIVFKPANGCAQLIRGSKAGWKPAFVLRNSFINKFTPTSPQFAWPATSNKYISKHIPCNDKF